MKKLASLLLALSLILSLGLVFTSCGDDGIDEEGWKAMLAAPNFSNYTLNQSGTMTMTMDGQSITNRQDAVLKINPDKIDHSLKIDGEEVINGVITGEEAAAQKANYEKTFLAVLADFNNFEYDTDEKVYKNPNKVIVDLTQGEYTAKLEMENGKVTLSEDGKLVKFTCKLTQTTTIPERGDQVAVGDITWTFSDYGTTVVADPAQ
ncbi:MAG: hypothetical protein IJW16_05330 [Clostridia bacterium]|nr:hypothetical protein [Clostridia bacterium]